MHIEPMNEKIQMFFRISFYIVFACCLYLTVRQGVFILTNAIQLSKATLLFIFAVTSIMLYSFGATRLKWIRQQPTVGSDSGIQRKTWAEIVLAQTVAAVMIAMYLSTMTSVR